MDRVGPFNFFLGNAGALAAADRTGSVSKDLRLVACIVSVGLLLPDSAVRWPIDRPLLCTNDFFESGFRVSEKDKKNASVLRNLDCRNEISAWLILPTFRVVNSNPAVESHARGFAGKVVLDHSFGPDNPQIFYYSFLSCQTLFRRSAWLLKLSRRASRTSTD
jgi:hypothetical protein